MKSMRGANAYARMGVESTVMSASPHRLITLLFEGAEASIRAACLHIEAGNIEAKGHAISKALDIVNNGLSAALDIEKGGDVAVSLESLYEFVSKTLMEANRESSVEKLEKASALLETIASAWRELGVRST